MTVTYPELKANIERIKASLPVGVRVLAATKTQPPEVINFALANGIDLIGENRVQELLEKYDAIDKDKCEIHFIGRLQTNKVKYIIDKVSMIHSVDSLKLASEIDRRAAACGKVMDVLVEINLANEESKGGISLIEASEFADALAEFGNLRMRGLMAVAPKCDDDEKNAVLFAKIYKKLIDISASKVYNGSIDILSAGMSNDYMAAALNGANIVRLGTALFGKRDQK